MYEHYLKNRQSKGDNLKGFLIDLEYYLEWIEDAHNIEARETLDKKNLLVGSFNFPANISEEHIAKQIETIWLDYLRYEEFEKHSYVISGRKVVFYFCTVSGNLGVTGKIVANGT